MKKFSLLLIIFFCTLLVGCGCCHTSDCYHPQAGFLKENWMWLVPKEPSFWTKDVDNWFLTGEPAYLGDYGKHLPLSRTITSMKIRVANFTKIRTSGNFQVQIVGGQNQDSVFLIGPNAAIRQIAVQVYGDTLCIQQIGYQAKQRPFPENLSYRVGKPSSCDCEDTRNIAPLEKVIIRISVRNLRELSARGCGDVYGRNIMSDSLMINSVSCGHILLNGVMNLRTVNQYGGGIVTVLGAYTPCLAINDLGNGTVNIYGRVGISSINNFGTGQVNIIGADSDSLYIRAGGASKTAILGCVNLKKVSAANLSRVYIYWVNAQDTSVLTRDKAEVGLAGRTTNLYLTTQDTSHFLGRYLNIQNAYVRSLNNSHANVTARERIFVAGANSSSVYFFGSPKILSRNTSGNAIVVTM